MKRFFGLFIVLLGTLVSVGQISMQTNLPPAMGLNSEQVFEVKINKGTYTNFSKYQLELPADVTVQEVDSKLGSFASEENRIKIIWVIAPAEPEFSIKMKLVSGSSSGQKTFVMKYFYMDADTKKEIEMNPLTVDFKEGAANSESNFVALRPKAASPLNTTTISITDLNTKNPEVIKQQVNQLRRDSKDANLVGEREKNKAELKLADANTAVSKAESLTNEDEKKTALEKANADKKKAEEELEVANRVLALAKSLDDNANEIETINKSVNPGAYNNQKLNTDVAVVPQATSSEASQKDIEKLKQTFNEPPTAPTESVKVTKTTSKEKEVETENGLVYRVQVGAFSKEPTKSDFKALGKVTVKTENGMYKVLVGSYSTKDEALKRREQVIGKGFDGFVVTYQDGVRVK